MRCVTLAMAAVALSAVALAAAPPAEPPGVKGKVEAVTLYRGQALVTRAVPVEGAAGSVELVVTGLPDQVVPDSLFAEAAAGIEVRAVRFRQRAIGEEPREEVRKIDQEIQLVQDRVAANKKRQELLTQRLAYLAKLDEFTAATAKADLAKGVLNYEALEKTSQFSFKQRDDTLTESLKLDTEARELAKQLALLQRQRSELTAGASRTVSEALVFLEKREAAKGAIKLSYVVSEAGWAPAYNFRSVKEGKAVNVEYNALVHQMSGEDWTGVSLTLSTASPAIAAHGPGLAPFRVSLASLGGQAPAQGKDIADKFQAAQKRLSEFRGRQQALASDSGYAANWEMNRAANEGQWAELAAGRDVLDLIRREPATTEGPSVSYALATPVSLASRADQQMLRIQDMELASQFYHVATPVLTAFVYREAEMTNNAAEVLLGGPVSVYLDGRFVGRGELPTVARGETFVMGFGADPQLRARRELLDKTESVQGGNREISLKIRLAIENYKDAEVKVRLFDRIPHPERKTDIRVTLGDMGTEKLSDDKLYLRLEQPKGILRWDIAVPAKASGEKARLLEYG
ncbi:MAG: mucoidy inhibitor MuiA family protein, partial [Planctomycetes bacterium]|nr:mucoidy inhibitor MuiA family protein [Planctomycetota bacterium]